MLNTKEHYDLMTQFEKTFNHFRLDREHKRLWQKGIIYQNGEANKAFITYRHGYAFGKAVGREG